MLSMFRKDLEAQLPALQKGETVEVNAETWLWQMNRKMRSNIHSYFAFNPPVLSIVYCK